MLETQLQILVRKPCFGETIGFQKPIISIFYKSEKPNNSSGNQLQSNIFTSPTRLLMLL